MYIVSANPTGIGTYCPPQPKLLTEAERKEIEELVRTNPRDSFGMKMLLGQFTRRPRP